MILRLLGLAATAMLATAPMSARAAPCPTTTLGPMTALPAATVGVSYTHALTASNTNATAFQFSVTSGLPAAIGLGMVGTGPGTANLAGTPNQVGSFLITISATDTLGCAGGRTFPIAIAQGSQTIAFTSTPPADATIGGTPYVVSATATSGLPVAFSIDASSSSVCSIAGASVTFQSVGTCVVNANQAGDANWNAAPQVQQSLVVGPDDQTITFTSSAPPSAMVGGATYTPTATATSGLPMTLTIDAAASGVCAISGGTVSFQSVGTCVVNANQAGDANWNAAPQVQQSFAVGQGAQTITFTSTAPTVSVGGASYTPSATASSGLPVTITVDAGASGVCAIGGGVVTFQSAGTCVLNANQAGDANWNAAPQVQQSVVVGPGAQTITYTSTAPTNAVLAGATYTVTATASSGLPVAFSIDAGASSVCSIAGATVSFIGAGTCVVNANQPGNANWLAAPQVQQSFTVGKGSQTITFTSTAPTSPFIGGPTYTVIASATSGLAAAFTIDASASAVCSVAGNVVSFIGEGSCVINANQAGDANWNPAPQVQQSFAVSGCQLLAVGQVALPSGSTSCFTGPAGSDADFTYISINNSLNSNTSLTLQGSNIQPVVGPPVPRPESEDSLSLAPLVDLPASDPHGITLPAAFPAGHRFAARDLVQPRGTGPLVVGQLIDLNASITGCGTTPSVRKARVEAITNPQSPGQTVLYLVQEVTELSPGVWTPAVAGGFTASDFQNIGDAFVQAPPGATPSPSFTGSTALLKSGAMNIETDNLGAVTDVDGNGGVIVFYTRALNELSPPAAPQVLPGAFLPRDLFAAASCGGSNEGEILYMLVPDPTGVVNSNVRTLPYVYGQAGPTLVHHYQHLVNAARRLYVHGASFLEEQWLDEALSWSMQELVFYNIAGLTPRADIPVSVLTTGPNAATRVSAFNTYENPIFGSMRSFFFQVGSSNGNRRLGPLRTTAFSTGGPSHDVLAQNFAHTHTFLRYAIDRKNTGDTAIFNALANSTLAGRANLDAVLGVDLDVWARDFLIGIYADDAVSGLAPEHRTPSWNYRSLYTALNGSYQLTVDTLLDNAPITFSVGFGAGARYSRFGVAAGQQATLTLTEGSNPPGANVRVAVVRTR